MKKKISILGSTGSIGVTTLNILNKKKNLFKINLLSADKNLNLICKQIKIYKPNFFIINNFKVFQKVKTKIKKTKTRIVLSNNFRFKSLAKSDITLSAIPGLDGLAPTIEMIKKSNKLLIANKESIICGWNIIKKVSKKYNTKIIPIDSEHFSIMQLLSDYKLCNVKKIYLTASGGPFLDRSVSSLKKIKPHEALRHPKWKMGKKITVNSSTLMNKILELIEAQKLFNIPNNKLDIIIHPESLVHAIVELKNGLNKFIYHETSMTIPIANAIFNNKVDIKDFVKSKTKKKINNLSFRNVDSRIFPMIKLKNVVNKHYSTPIIINAANELLVDQFLRKKIPFLSMYKLVLIVLKDRNYKKYAIKKPKNIDQIFKISEWTKKILMNKLNSNA